MLSNSVTNLRLQLLANGYTPLPNRDKICYLPNWPRVEVTPERIQEWAQLDRFQATGLRVGGGLVAIDPDVLRKDLVDALAAEATKHFGSDFFNRALVRGRDGSNKEMWLARMDPEQCKVGLDYRRWVDPSEPLITQQVEVFYQAGRQVGAFGPHSYDDRGQILHSYGWYDDLSPEKVKFKQLPLIKRAAIVAFLADCDAVFERAGFSAKPLGKDASHSQIVYNLTRDMDFDGMSWDELMSYAGAYPGGFRITAHFMDPAGVALKCMAHDSHPIYGAHIFNFDGYTAHKLVEEDPAVIMEEFGKAFAADAGINEMFPETEASVTAQRRQSFYEKLDELLTTAAYLRAGNGSAVMLDARREVPMTTKGFRDDNRAYWITEGKNNTKKYVGDAWLEHPDRINCAEVHMRPAEAWPLYTDAHGAQHVNLWRPIEHGDQSGDTAVFWRAFNHVIPGVADRQWVKESLAHKVRHPEIPGPAVFMVTNGVYGVGRSSLTQAIERLFDFRTTRWDFANMTGRGGQAEWNAHRADALFCFTDEAVNDDAHTATGKNHAYEHLKAVLDPSGTLPRQFKGKYLHAWTQPCPCTDWVLTNNPDAVHIPIEDRRVYVCQNANLKMPADLADELHAWMMVPGNIGALWAELFGQELTVFDPFLAPPLTDAKVRMHESSKTIVEEALDAVFVRLLQPVIAFREHVESMVLTLLGNDYYGDRKIKDAVHYQVKRRLLYHVGYRDGKNDRHPYQGKFIKLYAEKEDVAVQYRDRESEWLRVRALRNERARYTKDGFNTQMDEDD